MAYEPFKIAKEDGAGVITMTTPPANTYDFDFMRELDRVTGEIRLDEEIKVAAVTYTPPFAPVARARRLSGPRAAWHRRLADA